MQSLARSIAAAGLVLATLFAGASCSRGPSPAEVRAREAELRDAYQAGVEDARAEIAAGTVVIHRSGSMSAEVRIDREHGLRVMDPWAICGTGLDHEHYAAVLSGYEAEVDRALAARELAHLSLAHKIVAEAELRARFAAEPGTKIGADKGTLAAPGGTSRIDWSPLSRHPGKAVINLCRPDGPDEGDKEDFHGLPFNLVPQRILWDHDGTTLHALGPDGNLATVDVPTGTWISIYTPDG